MPVPLFFFGFTCPRTSINPLKMHPPQVFVPPPCPSPRPEPSTEAILPLLIFIPGYEPLTTTLTIDRLTELLPNLHAYIEPSFPSLAVLPAAGVSYIGLRGALRWREAEYQQPKVEQQSTLGEMVQIYQSLAFLG